MELKTPQTLMEAIRYYSDPAIAEAYFASKRWPNGVTCPHCGATKVYRLEAQCRWKCSGKHEQRQFSIKTATIMEDSPLPIDKWLCATWLIVNAKNGISSYEIHRALGITQKTAWFLLHRIRHALKVGNFEKMSGTVESDETYIGGKVQNFKKGKIAKLRGEAKALKPGKPVNLARVVKKAIVMGLLQRGKDGNASQMRAFHVESARISHLSEVILAHVNPGAMLMTDTLPSYQRLGAVGYHHAAINHALRYVDGDVHTNGVENFWALFKRMFKGTYIAVEPFHLHAYLDEETFRFNNRKVTDGERFTRALGGIDGKRLTYAQLTGKVGEVCPPKTKNEAMESR